MRKSIVFGMAGAAVGLFASLSQANASINLILNPTFNTGDFTDWTVGGSTATVVSSSGPGFTKAAQFGDTPDTLSQTVSTISGDTYDVSYYLLIGSSGEGQPSNDIVLTFGGQTLDILPNVLIPSYQFLESTVTVSGTSATFDASGFNDNGDTQISDISVSDDGVVPEPSTVAVLSIAGVGLAGLILSRRRQRSLRY